jgi:signal transduction histidine kinase/ActR/RegA family two-component response regulator
MNTERYAVLQGELEMQQDEEKKISILLKMAEEVKNFEVDKALALSDEVITRSQAIGYVAGVGHGLCLRGFCFRLMGKYNEGIDVLKEALTIARKLNNQTIEAVGHYYLGSIYRELGDLANVLTNYDRALVINQEMGDEYYQSVILSNISNLLFDCNDYDGALEYALKCLPIFERVNNVNSLLNIHNTLGNIYFKKEQFDDALKSFQENLKRSEPGTTAYVNAESGVGKVYYKMQHHEAAATHLLNALEKANEQGGVEVRVICTYYLGNLYMDRGDYDTALQYMLTALDVATEYKRRQDLMSIHEKLSDLYEKMGDIHTAFKYIKSFEKLKDEVFKQNVFNELNNLQARQQIELARKEKEVAERAAQLKHKFMANMSHEIRTPMNAIVGMTRLILAKDPRPEHLRYLNAIRMSADNLLVIINDILDFSKIEAGKVTIEHIDFNVREVMQGLHDMLYTKVEEKGIALITETDAAIPQMVVGDPTKVNQILINLAGNAIKFTEKGSVEIRAVLQRADDEQIVIRFDVKDSGIGIAPEYLGTIFDSFTQAGSDITRKFGGTGLGLSISKQLATLMGGDILIESELNKGSTFSAVIVFGRSAVQLEDRKEETLDDEKIQKLRKLKILLVEDNEFNRMVAEDTLQEYLPGISITMAVNGQDAIDQLQQEAFDVVLMDIQMPVMDGLTATKVIRKELTGQAQQVKIIAMTANVLQEDVKEYLAAGMDAYVSKPFHPQELLKKMSEVMTDTMPVGGDIANEPIVPEVAAPPVRVTSMDFIKQFTGGNPDKMKKYTTIFLDNAPKLLAQLDAGLAAADHGTIKIASHSLKPQMTYMGIKEEHSNIAGIEHAADRKDDFAVIGKMIGTLKTVCEQAFREIREQH